MYWIFTFAIFHQLFDIGDGQISYKVSRALCIDGLSTGVGCILAILAVSNTLAVQLSTLEIHTG